MTPPETATTPGTLGAQTAALRLRLQLQRRQIAAQLSPTGVAASPFPHSLTMRLLLEKRRRLLRLLGSAGALLLGRRLLRALGLTLLLVRLLRSLWHYRGRLHPPPSPLVLGSSAPPERLVTSAARPTPESAPMPGLVRL